MQNETAALKTPEPGRAVLGDGKLRVWPRSRPCDVPRALPGP